MRNTILGLACFIAAFVLWLTGPGESPRDAQAVQQTRSRADDAYLNRPIAELSVGDRVVALNPEVSDADRAAFGPEPNEATWRQLTLRMIKADGGRLDITMLRPLYWLDEAGAKVGATIELDLPELGAQGPATVLSVGPCPPIQPANPELGETHRVVISTFRHQAANVIDLHVKGMADPLGTTANHPFWSQDRQAFIEAGELKIGERLRLVTGNLAAVESITPRGPPEPVYNLEVHGEHVYFAGAFGALVHNSYGKKIGALDGRGLESHSVTCARRARMFHAAMGKPW